MFNVVSWVGCVVVGGLPAGPINGSQDLMDAGRSIEAEVNPLKQLRVELNSSCGNGPDSILDGLVSAVKGERAVFVFLLGVQSGRGVDLKSFTKNFERWHVLGLALEYEHKDGAAVYKNPVSKAVQVV